MASNYWPLSDICSTGPHQNSFAILQKKRYKQKNWTKFLQNIDLGPISENKFICKKKKKKDSIKY